MFVKRGRFFRGLVTVGGEWKAIAKLFRNQCRAKINSCSTAVPNFRGNCAERGRGAKSERWGAETRGRLPTGQSHRDLCVLIPRRTFIYWLSLQDIATDFVTAQLFHISYPIHILFFIVFFFFLRFFLSRKVLFYLACLEEDYSKRIRFQIVWQVRWIFSLLCKLLFNHIFTNIQIYRNFRNFGIGFKSK